ncbi:unnamed protein product [Cuscuta campestris]|uniref:Uncharacterized protein n=1 Tax=Cuscuta campestris TaxID=132261 RepID=A0A484M236_9ASTE|nr:unnamed protein product [Cuscuta campestris]
MTSPDLSAKNRMPQGRPEFSENGQALHDCMWMVLEDGPLKIQMENPERNPATPDVVQYIPKPKEKWDDRDCKKHNLDNIAKAAIFKTLDPITFSKIKHLKTAMEIWQGLGKLCEGSEDLRKQKIEFLLEKFKGFKMLPGESFDMLDERFHKILNDLASLNDVLSPKEKNVRLLRSLPTEWYTKATAMEEGRNLENYTVQGLLDELRTYEHELKKKKEEQLQEAWPLEVSVPVPKSGEFKKMMKDFEELNLKHSSLTEENKLLSEENLKLTEGRKSQLNEITQLKTENESLSEKVKSLNKELGTLKSKEAVDKLLETTKHKGREGLGFDSSSSKRKGKTTFIPPKPTAKPNKQKGKEKEKPTEVSKKDMASLKNISTNEVILTGKRIRNIYEVMWDNVKEACLISKDKDEEVNKEDRMKPTEFIPFRSLPLKISQRNPDSDGAEPSGNFGQPSNILDISNGDNSGNGDPVPIHPETPTTSVLQPEAELDQPVNPNQHNRRWLRDHPPQQIIGDIQSGVRTRSAQQNLEAMLALEVQRHSGKAEKESQMAEEEVSQTPIAIFEEPNEAEDSDSLSRYISNFALDEAEGESERTLKITDEEDVQEDAESLPLQLFQRTSSPHQVTNFHFHSSTIPTLSNEIPETWTKKVQGLIESALASQHASFRQEIELMEAKHTELIEKSEEKHSADLKEISKSVEKTLEIISLLSKTMSLLQMDIRSALAIASANQVVTKDYLKVIIDNQKEAYKLFRLIGAHSGNRKMEVILQQHNPSSIPHLPIAVNEGEASYVPSHLNMTNLILEAQQRNPENSAQHLSSSGLDGT